MGAEVLRRGGGIGGPEAGRGPEATSLPFRTIAAISLLIFVVFLAKVGPTVDKTATFKQNMATFGSQNTAS